MQQGMVMKFRARIEQLTLKKSVERGSLITKEEIAEGSGIPYSTLARLYNKPFKLMDADNVAKLQIYFGCTLDELIELIDD
ncbi:MAG: helix-turn-helix transcriptional regulator [Chloroflexota bacterium]